MTVSSYGFLVGHRAGWTTAQTTTEPTVSGMRVTTLTQYVCNLSYAVCDRFSAVTNTVKQLGTHLE